MSDKPYADLSAQMPKLVTTAPPGDYAGVTWLSENELVFVYAPLPDPSVNSGIDFVRFWEFQLWQYTMQSQKQMLLPVPKPDKCRLGGVSRIRRLTDTEFGFIYDCETTTGLRQEYLTVWDSVTQQIKALEEFPEQFFVQSYSVKPDASEILVASQGGGIDDKIYVTDAQTPLRQYFSNFARAAYPSWSPDATRIAFVGTEILPRPRDNPFTALLGIGDLLFYPWELYLADADGTNPRVILSEIKIPDSVKWSSNGSHVSFRGEYNGLQGIWIFNTLTSHLTRVWKNLDSYDWSPDGTKMVILEHQIINGKNQEIPVVISVPQVK